MGGREELVRSALPGRELIEEFCAAFAASLPPAAWGGREAP